VTVPAKLGDFSYVLLSPSSLSLLQLLGQPGESSAALG